ncbi:Trehalose and maltose hydrolase (possible phosphorylase) [Verrucomicrobium sp. GAS474]|uniref:glycosyl hydrolase family 65 protein n=1 Tax=Verrucomicrobium sp. GAS474 TaxID=1882831 RepID=UPI0008792DFF|nr:glycoside hydrolase family 65 protein [Verrucomicrobium sp. GAS474]SDT94471.1 Trehalose and maltose hydrolase (possible phosphorylase) [Verrucomicrobium sp. GAS474]
MSSREFDPGRLAADWLEKQPASGDPWILETTDPTDPGHRDALLGNGFLGQRFDRSGEASRNASGPYPVPGGCLIHGLWDDLALMPPPRWASLALQEGETTFAPGVGEWKNYRQRLDLRTGVLETELDWKNGGRETHITTTAYVSRTRPQVCFLERTLVTNYSGTVRMTDALDGTFIDDARDWRFTPGETSDAPLSIQLRMGPRDRQIAVLSRLSLEGIAAETLAVERRQTARSIERTLVFPVEAGRIYRVTKIVALVTDAEAPAPWPHAWALAEGALSDLPTLRREHDAAWAALWEHRIEVPHPGLQKLLNATLYSFYAQLRAGGLASLGPTGLSANCWGGHAFWDSDLWMFPGLCLLQPELARGFAAYRAATLDGARRNARAHGRAGAQFAWESAEFGDEAIPHLVYHHQHHVNSDVALAQWWFWKISGDDAFFRGKGSEIVVESARFWADRVFHNREKDRYEIRGVCCADEFAEIQDNNAYTNYSAVKTLELAAAVLAARGEAVPPSWRGIIAKMWIPFDIANQRYIEYEGYDGQTIKQADAALLIYPYEMPMSDTVRANTVDYYRAKYPPASIMMGTAFDGIVDCQLGRAESGWASLEKLLPHFREPYLLASESPSNEVLSFATGLGGLLQLVMMGFGGIRIREDGLQVEPALPRALPWMRLKGLCYGGVFLDLELKNNHVRILDPGIETPFRIERADGTPWPSS